MFSLFYGLIEYLMRRDEYHILILGLDKAGKTNVLERLKTQFTQFIGLDPGKILPTVGLNVGRIEAFKQHLILWDLGGQSGLRSIWDKYFNESHAVLYVVDSADKDRFEESRATLEQVLEARELAGAPVIILGNKQDLPAAAGVSEIAEQLGVPQFDKSTRTIQVLPACAYTGQGLKECVELLVELIKRSPRTTRLRVKSGQ